MKLTATEIPDVVLIEPSVHHDGRGWFMETFSERLFHAGLRELGLSTPRPFVQDNHSCSKRGVLRGLHYQREPHAQGKLVRVLSGAAFDVAVDIRPGSCTFGQWVGRVLSAENKNMLWIPEGFAHGFLALEDNTEFFYKTTDYYVKACEESIRWDDPEISIAWPKGFELEVSDKDMQAEFFKEKEF